MLVLREYQTEIIEKTRESIRGGKRRPLIVSPTGSGKSPVFASIINSAVEKGHTCLFLVHRRNLVKQFADTLVKFFRIQPGIIMAGEEFIEGNNVYVSTVQTYHRRMQLDELQFNKFFINADIILTDESHRTISKSYQDIFKAYSDKIIIGTTATPCLASGVGLGEVYDDIINVIDVAKLTDMGFLCPVRYYAPADIDLSKIKVKMGDYDEKQLDKAMNKAKLVGDVVQNWLKLAGNRKTIVFAVNVKHSMHIRDEFLKQGIPTAHLDAKSTEDERESVFNDMSNGAIQVICNVALYQEGMDVPDIACVVMARPTKSLGLYRQCVGRGLRVSEGKRDLVLLDHGGVVSEHGYITDEIEWTLDGKERAWKKNEKKEKEKKPMKCVACDMVFEGLDTCPDCGSKVRSFGKKVEAVDAELEEKKAVKKETIVDKRRYLGMLRHYVSRQKNSNPKRVTANYHQKYGCYPHHSIKDVSPIEPDEAFLNYQKHLLIKYLKGKNSRRTVENNASL